MPTKKRPHAASLHIRHVLDRATPPTAAAVLRHLNKCGQEIPDTEIGALLANGSPSLWLRRKIESDYRALYDNVLMPHLRRTYRRAGNHPTRKIRRDPPERPDIWRKHSDRFVEYMRREQEAAFRTMATAARAGMVAQAWGAEFFRAAYGLRAQNALRALHWAATRAQIMKADPDAIERMLRQNAERGFTRSSDIDPEEVEREQRRRKFESLKAVNKLKKEQAKMIAAEENTRAFQEGRWVSEEELREERAELERMLAGEQTRLRETNVYIREAVEVPEEFRATLERLDRMRELQREDEERAAAQRRLEAELAEEQRREEERRRAAEPARAIGMRRVEVWVTMLPQDVWNVCAVCSPMIFEERLVEDINNPENWPGNTVPVLAPRESQVHILCRCSSFYKTYIDRSDGSSDDYPDYDEYRDIWGERSGADIEEVLQRPIEAGDDFEDWAEALGIPARFRGKPRDGLA